MTQGKLISLIVIFAILVVGSMAFFTVDQREKAIMFKFGEIVSTDFDPGLHWKTGPAASNDPAGSNERSRATAHCLAQRGGHDGEGAGHGIPIEDG